MAQFIAERPNSQRTVDSIPGAEVQGGGIRSFHPEYTKWARQWKECRTVVEGAAAIKRAGTDFVPGLDEETPDEYDARIARAAVYEAGDTTLDMLLGALFRRPGTTNLPDTVAPLLENIDLIGTPYDGFKQRIASELLEVGRVGVLIDYSAEQGRPFWIIYETEQIRNWSYTIRDGRLVLDQVVLYEEGYRRHPSGFGTLRIPQYRVLELDERGIYQSRVYVQTKQPPKSATRPGTAQDPGDTVPVYEEDGAQQQTPTYQGQPFTEIPFVCFGRIDLLVTPQKPPLLTICDLELDHYRLDVDLKHHLHTTSLDGLFVIGDGDPEVPRKYYLGGLRANRLMAGASAQFVGVTAAYHGLVEEKAADEQRMALQGARMLMAPKRTAETAQSLEIHREGETAKLSTLSRALSLGLTRCWKFVVRWLGGDETAVEEELNRDFGLGGMDPQMIAAQLSLVIAGKLSQETFLENLYAGDISAEPETEQQRLDAEKVQAEQDAAAALAKQQAAMKKGMLMQPQQPVGPDGQPLPPQRGAKGRASKQKLDNLMGNQQQQPTPAAA